jgi:hypothetical protein
MFALLVLPAPTFAHPCLAVTLFVLGADRWTSRNLFGRARATESFRASVKVSAEAPRASVIKENYGATDNYRG